MTVYTKAIALADRLISKKGRCVFLQRENKTEGANRWEKDTQDIDKHKIQAVFLGSQKFVANGELVQSHTETVLVAALNLCIVPNTDDTLIDGTKVYTIKQVEPLKPGDEVIFYSLEVV